MRTHAQRGGGFTLVEVVFAVGILTIGALMLSAALSSSQRMSALARERAIANNVLRSYIERMRQTYPVATNDGNMLELINRAIVGGTGTATLNVTDGTTVPDSTPIYDLQKLYANGFVERGSLNGAVANVYMVTDESGGNWGPAITATITAPTSVASINTTTDVITTADKTALGLPRDLNANGSNGSTTTPLWDTNTVTVNSTNNIVLVPVKVQITWISGSTRTLTDATSGFVAPRQSLSMYAIFSPQH